MQTVFYILMAIIFVGILIYGFTKIFEVNNEITETERIEIKNLILDGYDYCEDPLNLGGEYTQNIKNKKFNTICLISDTESKSSKYYQEFENIILGGDNAILIDSSINFEDTDLDTFFKRSKIIDSFKIDNLIEESTCMTDKITIIC